MLCHTPPSVGIAAVAISTRMSAVKVPSLDKEAVKKFDILSRVSPFVVGLLVYQIFVRYIIIFGKYGADVRYIFCGVNLLCLTIVLGKWYSGTTCKWSIIYICIVRSALYFRFTELHQ